jgi:hypothetical protein
MYPVLEETLRTHTTMPSILRITPTIATRKRRLEHEERQRGGVSWFLSTLFRSGFIQFLDILFYFCVLLVCF